MSIFILGINHKTASIGMREKIYFPIDKVSLYLQDLLARELASEAVLLSTCNRSELYCEAKEVGRVVDWFCAQTTLTRPQLDTLLYVHQDEAAVAHIMQVACGLDSMVLGESQVLGQMKEAYSESCTAGAVASVFHRLFQQVFSVAKEIRTTSAVGACPVSVASAAVHFARQQLPAFASANVVLIGAGDTSELLIRYLKAHLATPVALVNRSLEKALAMLEIGGGQAFGFEDMARAITRADVVFSATGSAVPVVNKAMMTEVMRARRDKPLMLIDIAVPRDVELAVAELPHVALYCIDDLKAIIDNNLKGREHAAVKAREMIRVKSMAFIAELGTLDKVTHTIRAYRGQIEEICQVELMKARQQLQQGANAVEVLDAFAYAFTQKLLHAPSVQLRQAGAEGRFELLRFAKQLFAISDPEVELL